MSDHDPSLPSAQRDVDNAFSLAEAAARRVPRFLRGDATAAALLAWAERSDGWDPERGKLSTYVWPSMAGRAIDEARTYSRFVRKSPPPSQIANVLQSGPLVVRQALDQLQDCLDTGEVAVLEEVYFGGATLREAAQDCGKSEDAMYRANQRLIARLRRQMADRQLPRRRRAAEPADDLPSRHEEE